MARVRVQEHVGFYTGVGPGSIEVSLKTVGLDECRKALAELPKQIETKCINGALRDAGKIIIKATQANIRNRTGALSKSIGIRNSKKNPNVAVQLGPFKKTAKWKGRMVVPWYAHMVEWGTTAHKIKSRDRYGEERKALLLPGKGSHPIYEVDHPGMSAQRPFTRAVDMNRVKFIEKFQTYLNKFLDKHFEKYTGRAWNWSH